MSDPSFSLTDHVALVTGASRGIGAAIARAYTRRGAKVALASRKLDELERLAASLRDEGAEVLVQPTHVGKSDELDRLIDATMERFGGIDVLVNNAATNPVFGPALEVDGRAFDKIVEVNLKAPFELAKRVQPIMEARGGGSIVNISSIGGITPELGLGIYSVSKAALISLTKVLAREWGAAGIRVNAICPGLIRTQFSQALWQSEEIAATYIGDLPLGRIGEPDEVSGLAVYLAAPASSYVTGAIYAVDGGRTI